MNRADPATRCRRAEHCAALLSRYADAGCQRIYLWPLGDERRQIELVASEVVPRIER
jgi:hypothetical protein